MKNVCIQEDEESKESEGSLEYETIENKIEIIRSRYFEGANVHALFPVAEVLLDLGELVDVPSEPYFADELSSALPDIIEHSCSKGYKGGFLERLREGTYP